MPNQPIKEYPPYGDKPLMRGWFHAAAAVASLVITIIWIVQSAGQHTLFFSLLIFGLSQFLLYVVSAIYHLGNWSGRACHILRAIDHSNIYLLIAGTYTPFCMVLPAGAWRIGVLSVLWSLALVGVVLKLRLPYLPSWLSTSFYIGMGWIGVLIAPILWTVLPPAALWMLVIGGVLYTLGGVMYSLEWPRLSPKVFSFHEMFHLFTVGANVIFIVTVWVWVMPRA
jgi:hemolysin III